MAKKILFLGQGSSSDPGFEDVQLGGIPYKDYMSQRGIKVVSPPVIESCHGCYDIMKEYSEQMQRMVQYGEARVVGVLQGGLLFGLPSIQATQTTFPIISVPTDYAAFTSFMVPSGHAAIASVGVDIGSTSQKEKALTLAQRILDLEIPTVNVFASEEDYSRLLEKLHEYGIKNEFPKIMADGLSLVYGNESQMLQVPQTSFAIRVDGDEDMKDWNYFHKAELRHRRHEYNLVPCAQVRGLDNLAIFAAKIISMQRPELIEKILDIAKKKRASYPPKRDLYRELVG